jgi:hypothetical protein
MRNLTVIAMVLVATTCGRGIADVKRVRADVTFSTNSGAPVALAVGIADTPAERQKGLSGVTHITDGGVAFLYAYPATGEFWMKDTLIPLSVAFVRADGTIVAIWEMTPCTADPCRTYASPEPYTLAIETTPSWYGEHHIAVGDSAVLGAIAP